MSSRPHLPESVEQAVTEIHARLLQPVLRPVCGTCGCLLAATGEDCPGCRLEARTAAAAEIPDGMERCPSCTAVVQVLVDDVLCIRCDSILYPSTSWQVPA